MKYYLFTPKEEYIICDSLPYWLCKFDDSESPLPQLAKILNGKIMKPWKKSPFPIERMRDDPKYYCKEIRLEELVLMGIL